MKKKNQIRKGVSAIRKAGKSELHESEDRLRLLVDEVLDNSSVGIFILDANLQIAWVNKAIERYFGLNRDMIIGKDKRQTIRDEIQHIFEDSETFADKVSSAYETNIYLEEFECHVLQEGERDERWLVYQSMPIKSGLYAGGRIEHYHDITERKRAEEKIYKLSHAMEHCSATVVITDTGGNIEYVNPKFTQLTGYSHEDAIGENPRILKSGKTSDKVYNELWRTIISGREWNGEFCNKKKNGDLYWEAVSISPVKDDKGVITNYIAVKDDITNRKRTEEALAQSEQRFRQYFDLGLIGMAITSLEKGWVEFNDTLCNMFGYSRDDFSRLTWAELSHSGDLESDLAQFNRVLAGEIDGYSMQKRFIHKDGSILYAVISANAVRKPDSSVDYFVALVHDITERKKMEEALIQSEKLKSIGAITAGISHEFNNLLAVISGNVQLLDGAYKDDRVLTDALHTIMKATDDGTEISSNMLKFTSTYQDTKELVPSDIRELIKHSISFTKPRWKNEAQAKGIGYKMETECMKSIPPIMCKHSEMREIFINLINNSLDAMPGGGNLTFSTWNVDDTVFVKVSDNGEGMSDAVKKNIFDPFFSTKGVEGTGLGMSTVYGIVTRHGGRIEIDSEQGRGTAFTLQFPASNRSACLIKTPNTEHKTNAKSLRILVVDDVEGIRYILNQFLSRSGHNVKMADNGAEAINMIENEDFDLVLSDLAMPNVSGKELVNVLNGLTRKPKIGIITGWNEESQNIVSEDLEVDFILRKPFKHLELITHINVLFGMDSGG